MINLSIFFFGLSVSLNAQLSGSYTIGTGGDYETFSAAAEALHTQGVSGPVVFNVVSGTYQEQFILDYIPNASETDSVTFQSQSGDSSDVVIVSGDATFDDNYVVKLKRLSYVMFKQITFRSLNETYSSVVQIENYADHLSFYNCVFEGTYASDNRKSLIYSNSGTSIEDLILENNRFFKGGHAINLNCSGENNLSPQILSNSFDSIGYSSVSLNTAKKITITGNKINGGSFGMYLSMIIGKSIISKNRIVNISNEGVHISNLHSSMDFEAEISNNEIAANKNGGGGLIISNSYGFNVYHNSVFVNRDYYATKALSLTYCGSLVSVYNNNLICANSGYALYVKNSNELRGCDNNNYYSPGRVLAFWDDETLGEGVECEDLRTLKNISGTNAHSLFAWPGFESDTVLKPRSAWLDNAGKLLMMKDNDDIDDIVRDNPPDIGCYEFTASGDVKPPMSGTITIGSGGYATLQEVLDDARIKGVSDSLKIQFPSGTYNMQCVIPPITGASSKHPVIIESASGSAGDVTIQHEAVGFNDNYVIILNGSSFLQFRNLTFKALDERYCLLFDMSGMLDSLIFNSCVFTGKPISQQGTELFIADEDNMNFHYQKYVNNVFNYGKSSIYYNLSKHTSFPGKVEIKSNTFNESVNEAINLREIGEAVISNNVVDSTGKGFLLYVMDNVEVNNNKIITEYGNGLSLSTCSFSSDRPGRIYNNFVSSYGNTNKQGISITNTDTILLIYNSVYVNPVLDPYYGNIFCPLKVYGSNAVIMFNNIFFNNGTHYSIYVENSDIISSDNNCFYSEGTNLAFWNQDCADLEALKTASGKNEHSLFANPLFVSDVDLHVQNDALDSAGVYITGITKDIDGENRNLNYPDIGADEFGGGIVNNPPVAVNDTAEVVQGYTVRIHVLENDSDPDLDSIFIKSVGAAIEGHTSVSQDKTYIEYFVPDLTFAGIDSFKYEMQDKFGLVDSAMVYVTVKKPVAFEQTGIELDQLSHGTGLWADYDMDGDMDILLAGIDGDDSSEVRLYTNNGAGTFTAGDIFARISPGQMEGAAWGDFDNDGDPDLVITGYENFPAFVTKLYRNDAGQLTEIASGLPAVNHGSVDWGDFDNDGDLDLLIAGGTGNNNKITKIYENKGTGENNSWSFSETVVLPGISAGSAHWGDYDRDGDLDILISSNVYLEDVWLYENDGAGNFSRVANTGISGINGHSVWCDYNNDGYPDIIIAGDSSSVVVTATTIFKNIPNGQGRTFTYIPAGLLGLESGSISCGDYDVDGDADILITGRTENNEPTVKLYENKGNDVFEDTNMEFPGVVFSSATWADYNNDDRPDILLMGFHFDPEVDTVFGSGNRFTAVYEGKAAGNNLKPETPANLAAVISNEGVHLSWDAASDAETPAAGLTYNLRVGTTPGGSEIMSAMAKIPDGQMFIPQSGNVGSNTSWTLKDFPANTTCYWSVQAVDKAFAGSAFAQENSFMLENTGDSATIDVTVYDMFETPITLGSLMVFYEDGNMPYPDTSILFKNTDHKLITLKKGVMKLGFMTNRELFPGRLITYWDGKLTLGDADWFELNEDTSLDFMVRNLLRRVGTNRIIGLLRFYTSGDASLKSSTATDDNYWVYLIDNEGNVVQEALTADDGSFEFDSIPPGHYSFVADVGAIPMAAGNDSIIIEGDEQTISMDVDVHDDNITYSASNTTRVNSNLQNDEIAVFPNPAGDNIYLKFNKPAEDNMVLRIMSVDGTVVKKMKITGSTGIGISVSCLSKGVYLLNIRGKDVNFTTKVIKK